MSELQFSSIEEIFEIGLHTYLDGLQTKLNRIGDALCHTYIFQASTTALGDHLVQQEQQQQQESIAAAEHLYVDAGFHKRCSGDISHASLTASDEL